MRSDERQLVHLPPQTPEERFQNVDTDGNGEISLKETKAWVEKHGIKLEKDRGLEAAFEAMDTDGSGTIEPAEMDESLKEMSGT